MDIYIHGWDPPPAAGHRVGFLTPLPSRVRALHLIIMLTHTGRDTTCHSYYDTRTRTVANLGLSPCHSHEGEHLLQANLVRRFHPSSSFSALSTSSSPGGGSSRTFTSMGSAFMEPARSASPAIQGVPQARPPPTTSIRSSRPELPPCCDR